MIPQYLISEAKDLFRRAERMGLVSFDTRDLVQRSIQRGWITLPTQEAPRPAEAEDREIKAIKRREYRKLWMRAKRAKAN